MQDLVTSDLLQFSYQTAAQVFRIEIYNCMRQDQLSSKLYQPVLESHGANVGGTGLLYMQQNRCTGDHARSIGRLNMKK